MVENSTDSKHVCPWWLCFTFDNPVRKIFHNPVRILSPYVHKGDTVLDVGAGMGYFSIPLAELVGPFGHVTAIDIQTRMLSALVSRARRKGISKNIRTHLANPVSIGIHEKADFILAFWMVHEVSDQRRFLSEIINALKPGGLFLVVEPIIHVSMKNFLRTLQIATELGLFIKETPRIRISHSAILSYDRTSL